MIISILLSWPQYFKYIGLLLIVYYAIITYLYYRKQVLEIFTRSRMSANGTQRNKLKTTINDQAQTTHDLSEVHELMYNLQQSINNAQAMKLVKEELMMSLQVTIKAFPTSFTSLTDKASTNSSGLK